MVLTVGQEPDPAKRIRLAQGARIKALRDLRQLTQEQLGARIDPPVTGAAVSEWENGKASPRQHLQVAIAHALDAPWSSIFGLDLVAP